MQYQSPTHVVAGTMKVEIISIGTELLVSDILDTNSAYISRSLREAKVDLTCKVTVGDNPDMIAGVLRVALERADVVLTTGGLGRGRDDFTRQAVAVVTERPLTATEPGIAGAVLLGNPDKRLTGLMVEEAAGTIVCLPGNRREVAYLLETEVLPYLRRRIAGRAKSGWLLLRTVGVMESSLKQELADITLDPNYRITFDSFAGQTSIKLWADAESEELVTQKLENLRQVIVARLGDHVYGQGQDRLEEVVLQVLTRSGIKVAIAECYTHRILARSVGLLPGSEQVIYWVPTSAGNDLATQLQIEALSEDNLTQWCRTAAERLRLQSGADLGLIVYNNVTQGGVQILVTLASPNGVSVTQRSFGGHPENIDQWAFTLGLTHLRRWLLVHS